MKIKLVDELQSLLEQVPDLVNKYESIDFTFTESLKRWLSSGEKLLISHHKPQVSELAGLRGNVVAAERGVYESSFAFNPRMPKRKAAAAIAIFSLKKAQEILQVMLHPIVENVEESRALIKQVLALSDQKGILAQFRMAENEVTNSVLALWNNLAAIEDIRIGLNRILMLVSHAEALFLMEEILEEWPSYSLNEENKNAKN